jgi:hypothetical protein
MLAAPAHTIEDMRSRGLWGDTRLSDLPVFLRQIAEENVQHTVAPPALLNKIPLPELRRIAVDDSSGN